MQPHSSAAVYKTDADFPIFDLTNTRAHETKIYSDRLLFTPGN